MTKCGLDTCRVDHDAYRVHPSGQPFAYSPPPPVSQSPLAWLGLLVAALAGGAIVLFTFWVALVWLLSLGPVPTP